MKRNAMIASVILDIPHTKVDKIFEYAIPSDIEIKPGMRVFVPFGARSKREQGYVVSVSNTAKYDISKLKSIISPIDDFAALNENQIKLAKIVAKKEHIPVCSVLRCMFPSELRRNQVNIKTKKIIELSHEANIDELKQSCYSKNGALKSKNMLELLELLNKPAEFSSLTPNLQACARRGVEKGFIIENYEEVRRIPKTIEKKLNKITLTDDQQNCIDNVDISSLGGYLLFGVTGSGKTEVYAELINKALKKGKTAILLVPEISLTPQLIFMIQNRVDAPVAVLHSALSGGEKYDEWRRIAKGEAKVVIGARSAVFAPLNDLGIIIIDEEHEQSYKSEHTPKYQTHEIAKIRCELDSCAYLLGSATPSIESFYSARCGELKLLTIKKRLFELPLPQIKVADMREELSLGNRTMFSAQLYDELRKTLSMGKQAMLFINRRGHSTFVMCRGCGYTEYCDSCAVAMTYHSKSNLLKCHYCGRTKQTRKICPQCNKPYLKHFGIGTQKVEEAIKAEFPGARVLRMDFDTVKRKDSYIKIYSDFANNRADILIGTQMIAKGFHFENLRMVGVIAADLSLKLPDYRSPFRTFSLIEQVSGRAGRTSEGIVIVQTYNPEHYALSHAASHNYLGFYEEEIQTRRLLSLPPFGVFYRILFTDAHEQKIIGCAHDMFEELKKSLEKYTDDILIFNHGFAPVEKIDGKMRYQILIKTVKNGELNETILKTLENADYDVLFGLEINPNNMF